MPWSCRLKIYSVGGNSLLGLKRWPWTFSITHWIGLIYSSLSRLWEPFPRLPDHLELKISESPSYLLTEANTKSPFSFQSQEENVDAIKGKLEVMAAADTAQNNDQDKDDDDEEVESWWWRDLANLNQRLFDPIYSKHSKYHGELPLELGHAPSDWGKCIIFYDYNKISLLIVSSVVFIEYAGPRRTMFSMVGFDDPITIIEDPAYVLENENVDIPVGCHPGLLLLNRHYEDRRIQHTSIIQTPVGYLSSRASVFLRLPRCLRLFFLNSDLKIR